MSWFTCKTCAPHSQIDHSFYGDKACLMPRCPCKGYDPDKNNPIIKPPKKAGRFSVNTPLLSK